MIQIKNSGLETPFSPAPEALIQASCGPTGRGRLLVFLRMWKHAGKHDEAEISLATLAMECGLKISTAKRDLAWLVSNRWIQRIDRPGFTSRFHIRRFKGAPTAPGGRPESSADPDATPSHEPLQPGTRLARAPMGGEGAPHPPAWGRGNRREETEGNSHRIPPYIPPPTPLRCIGREADPRPEEVKAVLPPAAAGGKRRRLQPADEIELPSDAPELSADLSGLLLSWWRRRCTQHRRADRLALGRFTLQAIEHAEREGVLSDYLHKAIEAGWLSLGHPGSARLIEDLKNANQPFCTDMHTGSSMLRSGKPNPGHSGRRQEFLEGVVRMLSPLEDCDGP